MKKLLLLGAFGLLASPAFAQSVATVDQTGPSNDAALTQSNGSTADIDQTSYTAGGGNAVTGVTTADARQDGSTARVAQDGDGNTVRLDQAGADGYTAVGNPAGVWGADVRQEGDGHLASVTQDGDSYAEVAQFGGDGNEAVISQTLGDGHRSWTEQDGSDNAVDVSQQGAENDARISQTGSLNQATMTQVGNRHNAANWPNIGINQIGTGNVGSISQSGTGFVNNGHVATQNVRGDGNVVHQVQTGNWAPGLATGNESYVLVGRISGYGNGNYVSTAQDGDRNVARVTLTAPVGNPNDNNRVEVEQEGSRNAAGVTMVGDDNQASVRQTGTSNDLRGGSWDGVMVEGSGNRINALQDGTGNVATIAVTSGALGFVNNQVDLSQTGFSHDATITIAGDGNAATITQN